MADTTSDFQRALGRLVLTIINRDPIGTQMTALSEALVAQGARIAEDFTEMRRLLTESQANEAAALTNDAADAATIAAAQEAAAAAAARADELQADIDDALGVIGTTD